MAINLNNIRISLRTDLSANWAKKNPVLKNGEMAIVKFADGTENIKIGNGLSTFLLLPYMNEEKVLTKELMADNVYANSIALGYNVKATPTSLATGVFAEADGNFDVVHGIEAKALSGHDYAFVFNGVNLPGITNRYNSHGEGTFNINPTNGLSGFYVGDKNLSGILRDNFFDKGEIDVLYTTLDNQKADKATTLAGYGITDAKIASGVITLGSNTITPLTSNTNRINAVDSGITSSKVTKYDGYESTINSKADKTTLNQLSTNAMLSVANTNTLIATEVARASGAESYLSTEIGKKATKATTLAGYGITDAKIASGVITLGSNTITPLTSFASLTATTVSPTASETIASIGLSAGKISVTKLSIKIAESQVTNLTSDLNGLSTNTLNKVKVGKYGSALTNQDSLSIININEDDYLRLVAQGQILSAAVYIVSSDYLNAYDKQVRNVAEPILSSDAATKNYVDNSVAHISGNLSGNYYTKTQTNSISSYLNTKKADKATTLAGYGITDAKIASGVITLGSNTITPLTSNTNRINAVDSGITTAKVSTYDGYASTIAGKADKAITLAGYNIGDAYISDNTTDSKKVTLGSKTLSFLTAHQSLTAYETKADLTANYYKKSETSSNTQLNIELPKHMLSTNVDLIYDSASKYIRLKTFGEVRASINCADFIKDGMLSTVKIEGNYMVFYFNTDAGKQPVSVAVSSFFDKTQYYTKSETSSATLLTTAFSDKVGKTGSLNMEGPLTITGKSIESGLDYGVSELKLNNTRESGAHIYLADMMELSANSLYGTADIRFNGLSIAKFSGDTKSSDYFYLKNELSTASLVNTALASKANKATTLAGYGITDAKIASGVITLGSNTITPLTSNTNRVAAVDSGITSSKVTKYDGYESTINSKADKTTLNQLSTNAMLSVANTNTLIATEVSRATGVESVLSTAINGKAAKATTLAGYGITDAKIASGVITLGSNTITPLTAHLSLTGYYLKTETSSAALIADAIDNVNGAIAAEAGTREDTDKYLSSVISTDVKNLADNYYKKTETSSATLLTTALNKKANVLTGLHAGDIAGFDSTGNLIDTKLHTFNDVSGNVSLSVAGCLNVGTGCNFNNSNKAILGVAVFGEKSVATGKRCYAEGDHCVAGGIVARNSDDKYDDGATITGQYSNCHAEGKGSCANANNAHAEGAATTANGTNSHAEGYRTLTNAHAAHTEGDSSKANGIASHAEGKSTLADGPYSHTEGESVSAFGESSHAEGYGSKANGITSHAEGKNTLAHGAYSHSEGESTIAIGDSSHAGGYLTEANNLYSFAHGIRNKANGIASFAEGKDTIAQGEYSHSEGESVSAFGESSHAGGYLTKVNAQFGFAHGRGLEATNYCEAAFGKYNLTSVNDSLFTVGNGTDESHRSNAFEVKENGKAYAGGYEVTTEKTLSAYVELHAKVTIRHYDPDPEPTTGGKWTINVSCENGDNYTRVLSVYSEAMGYPGWSTQAPDPQGGGYSTLNSLTFKNSGWYFNFEQDFVSGSTSGDGTEKNISANGSGMPGNVVFTATWSAS